MRRQIAFLLVALLALQPALAQTPAPQLQGLSGADYVLYKSGSKYGLRNGQTGALVASGTDPGALLDTAFAALASSGGRVVVTPATYTYTSTVPNFRPGMPRRLTVEGRGAKIVLSAGAPRAFGFAKTADYQVFQHVELSGFTIDGQQLGGMNGAILGNLVSGSYQTRLSFDDVYVHDIVSANVKTNKDYGAGGGGSNPNDHSGHIILRLTGSPASPIYANNVRIERVTATGGNWGFLISGDSGTNETIDYLVMADSTVDMRPAGVEWQPSFFSSTCFHAGSYAVPNRVTFSGLTCYAPGDNCYEVNNAQLFTGTDNKCFNSWTAAWTLKNFTMPTSVATQTYNFTNTNSWVTANPPAGSTAIGFQIGSDVYPSGNYNFSNIGWGAKGNYTAAGETVPGTVLRIPALYKPVRSVAAVGVNVNWGQWTRTGTTAQYPTAVYSWPDNTGYDWSGDGTLEPTAFSVRDMTITGGVVTASNGSTNPNYIWFPGGKQTVSIANVVVVGNSNDTSGSIGLKFGGNASTIDARVSDVSFALSGGGTIYATQVTSTASLTIPNNITLDRVITGSATNLIDGTQTAKVATPATTSGTLTNGNAAKYNAAGQLVDAGGAPALLSGSTFTGNIVAPNAGTGTSALGFQFNTGYGPFIEGAVTANSNALFGHNLYGVSNSTTKYWGNTHGSFGSRSIEMDFGTGIDFYADSGATTAGSAATRTKRATILNGGGFKLFNASFGHTFTSSATADRAVSAPDAPGKLAIHTGTTSGGVALWSPIATTCTTTCSNAGLTCVGDIRDNATAGTGCADTTGTTNHVCLCY